MRKYLTATIVLLAIAMVAIVAWSLFLDPVVPRSDVKAAAVVAGGAPVNAVLPPSPVASERHAVDVPASIVAPAGRAEPGPEELWGRVVIAGTAVPIANAVVLLQHRDADEFWNLDLRYGEQVSTLLRTTSAADGTFRFAVARARQHRLSVRADGYAPTTVVDCTGGSEVVIGLSLGASVEGIVRCEGAGLVDIPVRIAVEGVGIELAAGRTEAGGAFRFTGLQPAAVFVQVRSPLHTQEWKRLELQVGAAHRVEIDLKAGVTLLGRVVEATTSAPIVDAELSDSWTFKRTVRADADGRFVMPGLADDSFVQIYVRAPGYASMSRNLAGQLGKEAEFAMVRGGEVTGRFVTASGGVPEAVYAAVGASYEEAPGMQGCDWIRADVLRDGRFQALGLRPDLHYWLMVRGSGYGARVYAVAHRLASGERLDLGDIVLRAAGGAEGRVLDDSGQPIAGISVSLAGANADSRAWLAPDQGPQTVSQFESRTIKTDQRGGFRFTSLAAGQYEIAVRQRSQRQKESVKVEVHDGAIGEGFEIVVPTGAVIEGVLRYAGGGTLGDEAAELFLMASREREQSTSARPEVGGHFRFAGLTEGAYTVSILRGPPGWSLSPRLGVPTGTKDLQLVLERSAFVSGRVVDAAGKGLKSQVYVRLDGVTSGSAMHATDADGNFRIEVPPDFHGSVGAHDLRDWAVSATVEGVVAGQHELLLQLKPLSEQVGRRR